MKSLFSIDNLRAQMKTFPLLWEISELLRNFIFRKFSL